MRAGHPLSQLLAAVVCAALARSSAFAQEAAFESLGSRLKTLVAQHEGQVAVLVRHLNSGREFSIAPDQVMPTASLIKVAVLVTAYREADAGRLDLSTRVELKDTDKVPGSGILTKHFSEGATLSVRDLIRAMIVWSDNTATNLVVHQFGLKRVNEVLAELGFKETRMHSLVFRGSTTSIDPENSKAFGLGRTTVAEMSRLLELIYNRKAASAEACDAMIEDMQHSETEPRLSARFPSSTVFAHKSGAVNSARTDAGILETDAGPVIICALTAKNKDRGWRSTSAPHVLLARIGQEVLRTFTRPWPSGTGAGRQELKQGDFGPMVEVLQRTLNARLTPNPKLSVDGDFGPATLAAVTKFQESYKLEPTGVVDRAVWKKLSPLHFRPEPVPEPAVINATQLPRAPADDDDGAPFVTCQAWAAVDAESGELIAGHAADQPLPMASTTKIMTAWLILRVAEGDPQVLEEVLTFSQRADQTRGSTSAIREGEQLTVRDTLFGLLLPSGNDASVALAEHFGVRAAALFEPDSPEKESPGGETELDPLSLFVEAMNREAKRLNLTKTRYHNPHGLDATGHLTTAGDLVRLARTALQNREFRDLVDTRIYGCQVTGPGGYTRNVSWKNTNQLLAVTGYSGVKTGTTSRAGACLVSLSARNGQETVLAVLGSAASRARYTDSRNLHRWLWKIRNGSTTRKSRM